VNSDTGSVDRVQVASAGAVLVAMIALTAADIAGAPMLRVAPAVAAVTVATVGHRSLLAWRTLLTTLILVILFIPIRRYTMPGHLPFQLEPYRLLVAFVAALWLTSLLIDSRVRLRSSGFEAPLAVIAFSALGSVLVNESRISALAVQSEVLKKLTFFASFFVVFYLILSVARTRATLDFLIKVLVVGGSVVAGFSLVEYRTHYNVFNHLASFIPFLKLTEWLTKEDVARGGRLRVYASAQHPIALGAMLVMLLPLAIYLGRRYRQRRWWLVAGMLGLGALATVSRTGVMMLLVVGLVFLWLRPAATKRVWPALIPALAVVHIALPGTIGTLKDAFFPKGGLIAQQQAAAVGHGRIADIGPSMAQFRRQPLLGQGFGTRVVDGPHPNAFILDDQWLGSLLETGLAGVIGWVWLFRRFVRRLAQEAKEDDSERGWALVAIAAAVSAYAVGMFTYDAFSFIQVTFLLYVLLGIGAALVNVRD
jgi:hypothetical protein